jgi:hypothetical protein
MRSQVFGRIIGTFIITLACTIAVAQPTTDAPTLKEKLTEKLVCDQANCQERQSGSFQCSYTEAGVDHQLFSTFNEFTGFNFALGDFSFSETLGSDPNYTAGDPAATLRLVNMKPNGGTRTVLTVKLSWKNDLLKIQIKGITPYVISPVAADRVGFQLVSYEENASLSFTVASAPVFGRSWPNTPYPSTRKVKTKTVNSTSYELDTITVTGPEIL